MKLIHEKEHKIHLKLTPKEWVYRGEGNANVVLALPEHSQILRIRKTEKPKTLFERTIDILMQWLSLEVTHSITDDVQAASSKNILKIGKLKNVLEQIINWMVQILNKKYKNVIYRELRDLKFYKKIIRPIIGCNYTCEATSVYISKDQINELEESLCTERPEYRKNKRLSYGKATLFEDFAVLPSTIGENLDLKGPTFAIEIKPKQGWYPLSEQINQKCQFCMKQYLKYERGQINKLSTYCPLDLFSGNKERMFTAIHGLIENPQNNFKIFQNGTFIYGENCEINQFNELLPVLFGINEETDLMQDFIDFLWRVLTKNFGFNGCDKSIVNDYNNLEDDERKDDSCSYTKSKLPQGCVLERILSMQKFNTLGLEKYNNICKTISLDESNDWKYVDIMLDIISKQKSECPCFILNETGLSNNLVDYKTSDVNTYLTLAQYLLFAIARDCSLMITFRKISGELREFKDCVIQTKYGNFAVNIGVFDLYPKPISTISKAVKRNVKISAAYTSLSSNIR